MLRNAAGSTYEMVSRLQPANDWNMVLPSEPQQNGAAVTPQLQDTTAKGQDDNRE